jgi:hypothetical protein
VRLRIAFGYGAVIGEVLARSEAGIDTHPSSSLMFGSPACHRVRE